MICIHHNDLDGRCSAAIIRKAFPKETIKFIETDYKDSLDVNQFCQGDRIIIVDFSLKPEVMADLLERLWIDDPANGSEVIWIDHHKTAKDYPYQHLPGLRNFEDKGDAGCELTWKYFFPDSPAPAVVRLIGDYDKWALKIPESKVFYEGMKLLDNSPNSDLWVDLFNDYEPDIMAVIQSGRLVTKYRDNYCAGVRKTFGYEAEIDGHRAYATNIYMFGSGGFGEKFDQYPLCIAYIHDGEKFTVSLYSETVDVGEIAKRHGGGGHKGAAGFVCKILPFYKEGLQPPGPGNFPHPKTMVA